MQTKTCTGCGNELPVSEFRPHEHGKHGVHSRCRACERARAREYMALRRKEHPEKVKDAKRRDYKKQRDKYIEYKRVRYLENRDAILVKASEYREQNREIIRQRSKIYRLNDIEKYRQKDREYHHKNKERRAEYRKRYRDAHRTETRQRNRARKQRLRDVAIDFTSGDWKRALEYFGNCCAACGRPQGLWHTIVADHWIPLVKGGQSVRTNMIPLCHGIDGCNNSKHGKDAGEWLIERFGKRRAKEVMARVSAYFDTLREKSEG